MYTYDNSKDVMDMDMTSSIDSGSRTDPLHPKAPKAPNETSSSSSTNYNHNHYYNYSINNRTSSNGLNETLDTEYIDIAPDDTSTFANATRAITKAVSSFCTPRQILIVLRILKAVTFAFLILTIVADCMFIFFVELKASREVSTKIGGTRDTVIRIYGLALTVIALMIELDVALVVQSFAGLKSFATRALMIFFIAAITSASPLHSDYKGRKNNNSNNNSYNDWYYNNNNNDDANSGGGGQYSDQQVSQEIPSSTVVFQMVTSLVLGCCALVYLVLGILCVDRLRSKAFISKRNPIEATAIPANSNIVTQSESAMSIP